MWPKYRCSLRTRPAVFTSLLQLSIASGLLSFSFFLGVVVVVLVVVVVVVVLLDASAVLLDASALLDAVIVAPGLATMIIPFVLTLLLSLSNGLQ
jgi:hypothetical protein